MRTLFTVRISGLFNEAEMKFFVGKVAQWSSHTEWVLKELSHLVGPDSNFPFEQINGPAQIWLDTLEEHTRQARIFEKRFRILCLEKIGNPSLESDLAVLFSLDE